MTPNRILDLLTAAKEKNMLAALEVDKVLSLATDILEGKSLAGMTHSERLLTDLLEEQGTCQLVDGVVLSIP